MRFNSEGPSIPDMLLEHRDAGRVVFLCGAGVSIGSGMPNFIDLTEHVIKYFDPPEDSEIMKAFRPWKEDQSTTINIYADIEGHPDEPPVARALEELQFFSTKVRILGAYPSHPFRVQQER